MTIRKLLSGFCVICFLSGCGRPENPSVTLPLPEGEDTVRGTVSYSFVAKDTLSTNLFLDYGIAAVDDIDGSSTGYIALLDGINTTITVLDPLGNAKTIGGSGSGPGEYQWPKAIAVASNGSVAVSDFMGGFVRLLEPDLETYNDLDGFIMQNPGKMILLDSGDFVGMRISFTSDNGQSYIGHQTALWSPSNVEPSLIYSESMRPFSLNDFGWSLVAPFPMTCSKDGLVYTADVSSSSYTIHSYSQDGTEIWSIRRPFEQMEKTQEELDIEKEMARTLMQQSEHQAEYDPDPYHLAVSDLALVPEGSLWAKRPSAETTFFDVYSTENGSYLYSVTTSEMFQRLEVTPAGILAITEGDSQSLLILGVEQIQASI